MPKKKQGSLADVLRKYLLEIPGAYWKKGLLLKERRREKNLNKH